MTAWTRTAAMVAALAIAGCSVTEDRVSAPAGPDAEQAVLERLFGVWQSTRGAAPPASDVDPAVVAAFEGLNVEVSPDYVIGLIGNRCDDPGFRSVGALAVSAIPPGGVTADLLDLDLDEAMEIAVACAGFEFDSLYLVDGDTLLTATDQAVYRLSRTAPAAGADGPRLTAALDGATLSGPTIVGAVPEFTEPATAPAADAPAAPYRTAGQPEPTADTESAAEPPTPPVDAPVTVAEADEGPPGPAADGPWPQTAAHLASYRRVDNLREGWRILAARFPALGDMTAMTTRVDVPGQGGFLRLLAVGGSAEAARSLCRSVAQTGAFCEVVTVEAAHGATALAGDLAAPTVVAAAPAAVSDAAVEAPPAAPEPTTTPPAAPEPPDRPDAPLAAADTIAEAGADETGTGGPPAPEPATDIAAPTQPAPMPEEVAEPVTAEPTETEPVETEPAAEIPADPPADTTDEADVAAPAVAAEPVGETEPVAETPEPAEEEPASLAVAALPPVLSSDYLVGAWGFEDRVRGCEGSDFIAFYPEGRASLYGEFEGTWEIDGNTVRLGLVPASAAGAGDTRNILLDMQVAEIAPDRFEAVFVSAGETAGMTAYRCP